VAFPGPTDEHGGGEVITAPLAFDWQVKGIANRGPSSLDVVLSGWLLGGL
jgi:hypothetical protein